MAQTIATTSPAYQAYQILYIEFIVAPLLAGLDKFTQFLTNWDQYLAPVVAGPLPVSGTCSCSSPIMRGGLQRLIDAEWGDDRRRHQRQHHVDVLA